MLDHYFAGLVIDKREKESMLMTMRKLLRKRSAVRRILQNLETRPVLQETTPVSFGWLNQLYPGIVHDSVCAPASFCQDGRR
jgi:hypothetical protein